MAFSSSFEGRIVQGHKVASGQAENSPYPAGTISLQSPFFKSLGLDLSPYYPGTLNINIHPHRFEMKDPDFIFTSIHWTDLVPPEDFLFKACRIIPAAGCIDGLIYYPSPRTKVQHFHSDSIIEVLAPFIPGLRYGAPIGILF